MWEEIASGSVLDLYSGMAQYDRMIPEGSKAMLRLNLRTSISREAAKQVEEGLKEKGIPDVRVATGAKVLNIFFRKSFPWLIAIAGTLAALIVLSILVVSWQLFKEAGPVGGSLTMLAAIAAAAVAGLLLLGRQKT